MLLIEHHKISSGCDRHPWYAPAAPIVVAFFIIADHFKLNALWFEVILLFVWLILSFLTRETVIDFSQQKVFLYNRLFKRKLLWMSGFSFSDFDGIICCPDGGWVRVGLKKRSGGRFWIRKFRFSECLQDRPAQEFAWQLSCDTGIEIDEPGFKSKKSVIQAPKKVAKQLNQISPQ